ncbi:hypothetical protein GOP47_0031013, partial [Adiantum capillus-veneris]
MSRNSIAGSFRFVWIKDMLTLAAWSGSRSHVGSIPSELGLMAGINYLHLNNNSLSGTIPPTLGD